MQRYKVVQGKNYKLHKLQGGGGTCPSAP